jgi:hypothetical protein
MRRRIFAAFLGKQPLFGSTKGIHSLRWRSIIAMTCGLSTTAGAAQAQETCVTCKGPQAAYRCSVEKSEKIAARLGSLGDKAIDHVCAKEMARQGGHESCSARREPGGLACSDVVRQIPLSTLLEAAAAKPAQPEPPPPVTPPGPAPAEQTAGQAGAPPRTVQELAEQTGEKSKQQLKDLGDSVGSAASKTWNCLSSLFKRC